MSESPSPRGSEKPPRGDRISPISDNEKEEQGMFSGLTFWLSVNVPSKIYYSEIIKKNGGKVTKFDKDAGILIADHLKDKADSDKDKVSYKFIEKCLKDKRLVDMEPFRVGSQGAKKMPAQKATAKAKVEVQVPVKQAEVGKRGRVFFTPEEDQMIFDYIDSHPQLGVGGNKLWQELCNFYPSAHTWHSWRSRYHKLLKGMPPPQLKVPAITKGAIPSKKEEKKERNSEGGAEGERSVVKTSQTVDSSKQEKRTTPQNKRLSQSERVKEEPKKTVYSQGDDLLLEGIMDDIIAAENKAERETIMKEFAQVYSHHSYEDWERRFLYLVKQKQKEEEQAVEEEMPRQREPSEEVGVPSTAVAKTSKSRYETPRHQKDNRPKKAPRSPHRHPVVDPANVPELPPVRHSPGRVHTPERQMPHQPKKPPRSPQGHPVVDEKENPKSKHVARSRPSKELAPASQDLVNLAPKPENAFKIFMALGREKYKAGLHGGQAPKAPEKRAREPEPQQEQEPARKRRTRSQSAEPLEKPRTDNTKRRRLRGKAVEIQSTPEPEPALAAIKENDVEMSDEAEEGGLNQPNTQAIFDNAETYRLSDEDIDVDDEYDGPELVKDEVAFTKQMTKKYGVKPEIAQIALYKTSAVKALSEKVVEHYSKHRGFPYEWPGVFSPADDNVVTSPNAAAIEGLAQKHSSDAVSMRMSYLNKVRQRAKVELDYS